MSTRAAPHAGGDPPRHRLPSATRLGRVRLQVSDLARSIAYYERVLGLRVLARGDGAATLAAHGDDAPLVELHERPGATPVPRRGRLGLYHFAILLPNREALGRFIAHLARIGEYAGMSDHLVSEALYLTDPDGLGIEVYADRPRSSWRYESEQIEMATTPLDAADLIRAAGDEPWNGMPAGTVIGHVHLYIDDLAEGAAFYHDTLGFDKTVWNYPGALFMSAGGYHHHLGTNTWAAGAPRSQDADARLIDWEIVLPTDADVAAAAERLTGSGYHVVADGRHAQATDPWGTTLRLVREPTPSPSLARAHL